MGYIEELRALVGHRPLILPGAVVIVLNDKGEILLQQRKHPKGYWGIPGGLMELGESLEDTARRELFEETRLRIGELQLLNVYSGPDQFVVAANGDEFYVVTSAFITKDVTGELVVDEKESLDFQYFHLDQLPEKIAGTHRVMLEEYASKVNK